MEPVVEVPTKTGLRDPDLEEMPSGLHAVADRGKAQALEISEGLKITSRDGLPPLDEPRQLLQLAHPKGALDVGDAVVEAQIVLLRVPRALLWTLPPSPRSRRWPARASSWRTTPVTST